MDFFFYYKHVILIKDSMGDMKKPGYIHFNDNTWASILDI